MPKAENYWTCTIGPFTVVLPADADLSMRNAVKDAFSRLTGSIATACASEWSSPAPGSPPGEGAKEVGALVRKIELELRNAKVARDDLRVLKASSDAGLAERSVVLRHQQDLLEGLLLLAKEGER